MRHFQLQLLAEERTQEATPRKRERVRSRGQVARSPELGTAVVLGSALLMLVVLAPYSSSQLLKLIHYILANPQPLETPQQGIQLLRQVAIRSFLILAPWLAVLVALSLGVGLLQTRFVFSVYPLRPDLNHINPVEGFKRLFSRRSLAELGKSVLKLALLGYSVLPVAESFWGRFLAVQGQGVAASLHLFAAAVKAAGMRMVAVLLVIAAADYAYQRWEFSRQIRMTPREVKEEERETEGEPLLRAKRREQQRTMARRRMMAAVPGADVVITNPTHYAVALKYDPAGMDAPQVVAKGRGYVAERIKEIARANGVALMAEPPLARALYGSVEVGQSIPEHLYQAVAEVLAFVWRLEGRGGRT